MQDDELLDPETYMISTSESSTDHESDTPEDPDYLETPSSQMKRKLYFKTPPTKRINLASFASACDQTGISDRAAAVIASSLLHDNVGCSETNPLLVLDRSKVRRSCQKHHRFLQERSKEADDNEDIIGLYFDGRKDQTMTKKVFGNSKEIVQEEHISLVEEPGSKYFGHFALKKVSANAIADGIFDFVSANHKEKNNIIAIGCDGTAVNTGAKGGAIKMIELKLNKPVHWFICQLHTNELPLRHLFQTLDGKTTGPKGYSGNIGKMLDGCEKLDVVNFKPVLFDLLDMSQIDLSTDQQYLYDIHQSVSAGKLSEGLANKNPGKIAQS